MNTYFLCMFLTLCITTATECFLVSYKLSSNAKHNILSATWTLENKNGSIRIPGSVPGGVYSDLQKAGILGDILAGFNDVNTRWVAYDTWSYTANFSVPSQVIRSSRHMQLVFEGVDTVAYIELNGIPIGSTRNMFVQYVFDIATALRGGSNELRITFDSPVEVAKNRSNKYFTAPECVPEVYHGECHANQIRKMQASFSWDWGPAFPSVGLWRPAYIDFFSDFVIRHVTTHTEKISEHWFLNIKLHIASSPHHKDAPGTITASLIANNKYIIKIQNDTNINTDRNGSGVLEINLLIREEHVDTWWPNGYGNPHLYSLHVSATSKLTPDFIVHKQVRIGFRSVEVIEEDASKWLGNTTGGQGLTFYFKVNGYPLFMKGSNWIPANILPEHSPNRNTIDSLLLAARDAHMSMLRVWGGGLYESDYFYKRCDELGILIWQDFAFACSMYPADPEYLDNVKSEVEYNVLRLQHHPSIAIWAGNNENEVALRGNWYNTQSDFERYKQEYIKLYVDTIKPIVESLDPDRTYLVSSPSNGLESEKEGYIAANPYDSHYGDTHYYNYLADNWNMNIYPPTRFASEYGFQSLPSLKTMRTATTDDNDFHVDSEFSIHRQHSPNGYTYIEDQMLKHLNLNKNDTEYFAKFVFYSQISQAMAMKAETEFYRQSQADWHTMGAMYWQLNDVWQAPSWSGIEYGGKWKMLHYFAKRFFAPVLVSPRLTLSNNIDIYLINDRFVPVTDGQIKVDVFNWSSLTALVSRSFTANAGPLISKKQDVSVNFWKDHDLEEIFLRFSMDIDGVSLSPYNYIFPKPLKGVKGLKEPKIEITVSDYRPQNKHDEVKMGSGDNIYEINIKVDTIVLFLWLESEDNDGHFQDNGFIVTEENVAVVYTSRKKYKPKDLEKLITYRYYLHE